MYIYIFQFVVGVESLLYQVEPFVRAECDLFVFAPIVLNILKKCIVGIVQKVLYQYTILVQRVEHLRHFVVELHATYLFHFSARTERVAKI